MPTTYSSIECPTCQTTFHGVEVADGLAALEARPCAECGAPLCPACAQFACDGCGHTLCQAHAVSIPDGTDRPLQCCAACAEECETQYCPVCDSPNVCTDYLDCGFEAETGYHDVAAVFTCRACGARGEAEELVTRPAILRPELVARKAPARETREAAARARA